MIDNILDNFSFSLQMYAGVFVSKKILIHWNFLVQIEKDLLNNILGLRKSRQIFLHVSALHVVCWRLAVFDKLVVVNDLEAVVNDVELLGHLLLFGFGPR